MDSPFYGYNSGGYFDDDSLLMKFGKIDNYILFGAGELLEWTAGQLDNISVVTCKRRSKELSIEHVVVDDPMEIADRITNTTMGISFGASWIFKREFIDPFGGRLVNLHAARLPQDRGGGGFSWRILNNGRCGMSLIHLIDAGVDTGPIILTREYPFIGRTPLEYHKCSIENYKKLLTLFLKMLRHGELFNMSTQQEHLSTYWPRLSTENQGYIDWSWSLSDIERFICAFDDPHAGASTFVGNHKARLKKCTFINGKFHPFQTGIVYRKTDSALFIATAGGTLIAKDVDITVRVGDRFHTPSKYLEEARRTRVTYSA